MSKYTVSIIIPTYNNPQYLNPCIVSIAKLLAYRSGELQIIIINNGKQPCKEEFKDFKHILVIDSPDNIGWEGGLNLGLKYSDAMFVCFQNDDTFIPQCEVMFYENLLYPFQNKRVGVVGPITTVASGLQSVFHPQTPSFLIEASFLIYFCAMVRRSYLDEVGGIDPTLPGGDDFDLSIRMRKAGYVSLIQPRSFLIHHAFKTGERVKGGHDVIDGWNSREMQDKTNHALIVKHGFKTFIETMFGFTYDYKIPTEDKEADLIRSRLNGELHVLELGCGHQKTVKHAIGLDIVPRGEIISNLGDGNNISIADSVCDVTKELPFQDNSQDVIIARHILEHCIDTVDVLRKWQRVLKIGGKLIVAVPDENVGEGIPLNPEHVHAFTQDSLTSVMELVGFKKVETKYCDNGVSFMGIYEKV